MFFHPDKYLTEAQLQAIRRIRIFIKNMKGNPRFAGKNVMVTYQMYIDEYGELREVSKICVLDVWSARPVVIMEIPRPLEELTEEDLIPYAAQIRAPKA